MAHPVGGGVQLSESESHPENVRSHAAVYQISLGICRVPLLAAKNKTPRKDRKMLGILPIFLCLTFSWNIGVYSFIRVKMKTTILSL